MKSLEGLWVHLADWCIEHWPVHGPIDLIGSRTKWIGCNRHIDVHVIHVRLIPEQSRVWQGRRRERPGAWELGRIGRELETWETERRLVEGTIGRWCLDRSPGNHCSRGSKSISCTLVGTPPRRRIPRGRWRLHLRRVHTDGTRPDRRVRLQGGTRPAGYR
jgi:hypothetical protein